MIMERLKFPKFTQKLAELKKIEIDKVDAFFKPLIEKALTNSTRLQISSKEAPEYQKKYEEADKFFKEIQEQWKEARQKANDRAEQLTFEIFTKDTETTIKLLKNEIPIQIKFIALTVLNLSFYNEYNEYNKFTQKDNPNFKVEPSEAELVFFNDDAIIEHLKDVLLPFLNMLKEKDERGFQKAYKLIEENVKNKNKILSEMKEEVLTVFKDTTQDNKNNQLIKAKTHLAKELVSGNTKLEQVVFNPEKNPALYDPYIAAADINIGNRGKNIINVIASIDFDNMKKMGVHIPHESWLTPFDREVLSIASSLYVAGNDYQSPQMIYQAMSGNKEKITLTPDIRTKIVKSLEKLRYTKIEINSSQEEKVGWNKKSNYDGAILPSEHIEIMMLNGQTVIDCIHMFRNSPLYDYAEDKNQISRVNIEMLQAPINNTTENIELKFHLLRLISSMKNPKSKLTPIIRYDTLYKYLGIDENDADVRHKKKFIRDRVKKILSFWVKKDFISGFEEKKEKGKIVKVKISL